MSHRLTGNHEASKTFCSNFCKILFIFLKCKIYCFSEQPAYILSQTTMMKIIENKCKLLT